MVRREKIILTVTVTALIVAAAVFLLCPRDSGEPGVIEAKIIGSDSYGNHKLNVTEEQLHSIGADVGYDVYLELCGERMVATHVHDWNGVPFAAMFISYTVATDEMVLGLFNGDISAEMEIKVGDSVRISLKGPNKYCGSLDKYLT